MKKFIKKIIYLPALKQIFQKKDLNKIVEFMVNDKKNNDNKINLNTFKKIGKTTNPGKIKMS